MQIHDEEDFFEENFQQSFKIVVPQDQSPERVDKFLSSKSGYTRSRISKYTKKIFINGKEDKLSRIVYPYDVVEIYLEPLQEYNEIIPQYYDLNILYEDKAILVLNKPAGITVHPASGHPENTILNYVKYHFLKEGLIPLGDCGMVHRLDKDTEGLLIFAKDEKTQANLRLQFANRLVKKKYLAILNGKILPEYATFVDRLQRNPLDRFRYKTGKEGREAILSYKAISTGGNYSVVDIDLQTGRTHQIRVQFSSRGYPVAGDPIYGRDWNRIYEKYGMLLLSRKIEFIHPNLNKSIEFSIDLPERFKNFLKDNEIYLKEF
ncbi:MAG: RluA family pseudouridine synthase [Spirochaetes bacterium]|nr:RluA family pseudouridine synthase [Spirochaetota bacterium]NLJ04658.1 RluA family pseudouridine synthase [Exilispira sp.]MBP8990804.1 RluA family pseudouridine synthase [Spirochaetota bacterium]HNV43198.1 RluA family pseudouridine synthase [Exilispira sp.]HOV45621.1 RluA family pseudouridine synthase [Exilispira sp.]